MGKESKFAQILNNEENVDLSLSYSRVSDYDRNGPKALLSKTNKDSQALKKGSLVDDLLFSKDSFNDNYYISDFNEPTATLGILCKIILDNYSEIPDNETVLEIVKKNGLWKSVKKEETLIANYNTDEFWGYLNDKYNCGNRIVVTSSEKLNADEIVSILSTHKYSKSIFSAEMEHIYQYPFKIKIKEFTFKGILDILSIDHKNKIIYFKDLKTGIGISSEFTSSYIKWRYYLQEAVYCLAFKEICKELGLENYTLAPFEFLYISLKEKIPVSFIVSEKWHNAALYGFVTSGGYRYKGLYELINEIYFHWKNKIYDIPKEVYENNGSITLKDDFINLI